MNGFLNVLNFIYSNWMTIIVVVGIIAGVVIRAIKFFSNSNDERVKSVKEQIRVTILKMVTDAEQNYDGWNKAGSIKRAQVISKIYETYPILSIVVDQADLIAWIDKEIDNALVVLKDIISKND